MTKRWLAAAFGLALAAIVYVPIAQPPPEQEPDLSFRATTHDAFARKLQLGRDIISTYGPWGVLQRGYDPRTDAAVLIATSLLAAAFAWGVFRLALDAKAGALSIALIALCASALVAAAGHDGRYMVLPLLLALSMLEPWSASRELPIVLALGLVALIKFTLLVFVPLVVVGVAVARRRWVHVVVFAAGLLSCWVIGGQRVSGLPGFLWTAAEVARGYGAASASVGMGVPLALWGAVGLVLIVAAVERDLVRTLVLGGAALMLVRIGYVRADQSHTAVADALLLFLIGGYFLLHRAQRASLIGGIAAGLVALLAAGPVLADRALLQWSWLRSRPAHLATYERDLVARAGAVPAVSGTIDAYPAGSAALIAHRLRYVPRPVFQSNMAWTAKLEAINADFLRGPRAPQWLWVDVGAVDGRLPLLDDGPSWLEMARRYDMLVHRSDHLLLQRRDGPKPPPPNLLWATCEVDRPLGARIRDALGRAHGATLELTTADGKRTAWRAAPDMLRAGFILSPLVENVDDLERLFAGDDTRRVTGASVLYDGRRYALRVIAARTLPLASGTAPAPSGRRTSRRR